ncbi:hypothetical protein [Undibacter mobilis]|uniref:Uncharacterized protein n=1 Tax=Undibacter mobilis TaxID=2292256 RepID=A0A371B8X2_9BRAD|nr:hypothetical protein [Undibacter mobilis]RDV03957.1 hypothetical protein DXH78_04765 [Undibacter mobilis]
MSANLPKTVLLATATLLLALAALVTDIISPYADVAVTKPAQVQQVPSSLRVPVRTGPSEVAFISSHPAS